MDFSCGSRTPLGLGSPEMSLALSSLGTAWPVGRCCKSGVHWWGLLKMLGHPQFKELSQKPRVTKHARWAQEGKGVPGEEAAHGRAGRAWRGVRGPGVLGAWVAGLRVPGRARSCVGDGLAW